MGEVRNTVSETFNLGVVVQGEHVMVQVTPAMAGLPAAESSFTGRQQDLKALLQVLDPHNDPTAGGGAVGGMGGVGKTALGVWAARAALERGWFGGGVLFVDMLGYDHERPRAADAAVRGFLRAMAVPDEHIPADADERTVLYRSVLEGYASEGRPVLVFIDNVSDARQALPLLPGSNSCRAVVTSRQRLVGLDARLIDLDALDKGEAVTLLTRALHTRLPGDGRLDDDPGAAGELTLLCGGLPLALQIAAALLARNPHLTAAALTGILRPEAGRLTELADHRGTLHAVFDLSYQRLLSDQQELFALLPAAYGPDLSTSAAAALAGFDVTRARHALEGLADAHLIEPAPAPTGVSSGGGCTTCCAYTPTGCPSPTATGKPLAPSSWTITRPSPNRLPPTLPRPSPVISPPMSSPAATAPWPGWTPNSTTSPPPSPLNQPATTTANSPTTSPSPSLDTLTGDATSTSGSLSRPSPSDTLDTSPTGTARAGR